LKKKKPDLNLSAEPLFFHPHYEEKIWGGRKLSSLFGRVLPSEKTIGESWELSAIGGASTTIAKGDLAGMPLDQLYRQASEPLNGPVAAGGTAFPLLVKFIDAHERLSVQVHPDDRLARELFGEPFGKTECWYVADAGTYGALAVGLKKEVTEDELRVAAKSGAIEQLLNIVPVKNGEVYFIPATTIHAILGDVVIYEVQQSSDTTLRLYDWKRTDASGLPRPLHLDDAVRVADRSSRQSYLIDPLALPAEGYVHNIRIACSHFALEEFIVPDGGGTVRIAPRASCRILTILDGDLRLDWESGATPVKKGETVVLPAILGEVSVTGSEACCFLMTTVPDLQREIVGQLEEARYTPPRIRQLMGDRDGVSSGDR
jgi:mannose-6-phosphate isomerase